jgi:hypothetical protein
MGTKKLLVVTLSILSMGCADQANLLNSQAGIFSQEDTGYTMQAVNAHDANEAQTAEQSSVQTQLVEKVQAYEEHQLFLNLMQETYVRSPSTQEAVRDSQSAPVAPVQPVPEAPVLTSTEVLLQPEHVVENVQVLSPQEEFVAEGLTDLGLELPRDLYDHLKLGGTETEVLVGVEVDGDQSNHCVGKSGSAYPVRYDHTSNKVDKYFWHMQLDLGKYRCSEKVKVKYHCDGQGRSFTTTSKDEGKKCDKEKRVKISFKVKSRGKSKYFYREGRLKSAQAENEVSYVPAQYWDFSSGVAKCIARANESKNKQSHSSRK